MSLETVEQDQRWFDTGSVGKRILGTVKIFRIRLFLPQWALLLVSECVELWRPGTHPPLPLSYTSQWHSPENRKYQHDSLYHWKY